MEPWRILVNSIASWIMLHKTISTVIALFVLFKILDD